MKTNAIVTLRQIAVKADCDHSTISLALRNDPRLPAATRRRIQKLAQKMGYRPNPLVATLMTLLRGIRQKPYVATLAWIQHHEPRDEELRLAGEYMFPFAAARATQLGYQMESFWMHEPGMTVARLSRILHARNIRGVILAPWTKYQTFWPLRWERLSVVAIGNTPFQPDIHRVVPDIFSNITLILKQLRELGYQRIGLAIPEWERNMGLEQVSGPFQLHHEKSLPSNRIPRLVIPDFNPKGEQQFTSYMRKYRPEALVCSGVIFKTWLKKLGLSVPKDIGLVETDVTSDPGTRDWAGIDLQADRLAASAVDLLVSELQNHRLGLPAFPKVITIKGKWVAGTTLRKSAGGAAPEWQPGAVIGILMDSSLTWEYTYYDRKLVHEIEREVARTGMENDLERKQGRSDSSNVTGANRPRWIIRVYDQLGMLFRGDPAWDQNCQRLADDLRYHDFRGWIVKGSCLDQLPDRREIEHMPNVKIDTDDTVIRFGRRDFIYQSVKHLVRHGRQRICYLGDKTCPSEGETFRAVARELGTAEAQLVLADYELPMDECPVSAERIFSQEVALYELTLELVNRWKRNVKGPDGLIVWDDTAMRPVAMALAKAGVAVPRQLMVISHANEGIHHPYVVPVVRYEFPVTKIARELVRILRQRMAGEPVGPLPVVIRGRIVPE